MTDRRSARCSPVSADSTSASSAPAGPAAGKSSSTRSVDGSSSGTGRTSSDTAISARSTGPASSRSTWSAAGSRVSLSATQADDERRPILAGYGRNLPDAFAHYSLDSSLWKTSQESLWGTQWATFSENWPRSGMTRNGRSYRLRPSAHRIAATGSGFWHTPTASDRDGRPRWDHRASPGHVRAIPVPNLTAQIIERQSWPTPTAADAIGSRRATARQEHWTSNPGTTLLDAALIADGITSVPTRAQRSSWPTPTSRDHKDTGDSISRGTVPVNGLLGRAVGPSIAGGSLNPDWVDWLMGFPVGWTDCAR